MNNINDLGGEYTYTIVPKPKIEDAVTGLLFNDTPKHGKHRYNTPVKSSKAIKKAKSKSRMVKQSRKRNR